VLRRLLYVAFFLEVGLLLIVLPWSAFWDGNYFVHAWPSLRQVLADLDAWNIRSDWRELAAELGWFVAEHGRQPWAIEGVLPTFLGVSSISPGQVWFSLTGFVLFYSALAVVDVWLMVKYARLGPERALGHGNGHYGRAAAPSE